MTEKMTTIIASVAETVVLQFIRRIRKNRPQEQHDGIAAEAFGLFPASRQIGVKAPSVLTAVARTIISSLGTTDGRAIMWNPRY